MKGLILFTLLSVLFVSDYALAQTCPCDTLELSNGLTGDEIVDILCPGGVVGEGTVFTVTEEFVTIESASVFYSATIVPPAGCGIDGSNVDPEGLILTVEDAESCMARLIQGCSLNTRNIPTLSQWGMIAMAGVLGLIGLYAAMRRRKAAV